MGDCNINLLFVPSIKTSLWGAGTHLCPEDDKGLGQFASVTKDKWAYFKAELWKIVFRF